MAATIPERIIPGARVAAAATVGRMACKFSAVTLGPLLAGGNLAARAAGVEAGGNGAGNL